MVASARDRPAPTGLRPCCHLRSLLKSVIAILLCEPFSEVAQLSFGATINGLRRCVRSFHQVTTLDSGSAGRGQYFRRFPAPLNLPSISDADGIRTRIYLIESQVS
jgi:hypothetical protein